MTPPPYSEESDVDARYRALLFLHAQSPAFRDIDLSGLPGYEELSIDAALQVVAAAPLDQISVSARLAVLYDLNRAGAPDRGLHATGYREVAGSALAGKTDLPPGLGPDSLLDDLVASASAGVPFDTTSSAEMFDHHETAFVGVDVCEIRRVRVGGIDATWIYSEFETDAPFRDVADWVDPRNWHTWGPLFFRRMDLLMSPPAPVDINPPPPGEQHWHGVFHEEVALVQVLNTLLRCSYWRDPAAAAMTYDLKDSVDDEIDVDRGFLLVTDVDGVRRVQVLKIVSFTTDWWDLVARLVCPFWTDWVRFAVRGGTKSVRLPPTLFAPGIGSPLAACVDAWVAFAGESAKPYLGLAEDVAYRVRDGEYATPDLLRDGMRAWDRLAKDWARAWTTWTQTVDRVAEHGLDAGLLPPGASPEAGTHAVTAMFSGAPTQRDGAVVPVAGLKETDRAVSSDLVSIDAGSATIPATDVAVTVQRLQDGTVAARVQTTNAAVPQGLYVGRLATPDGRPLAPVHLYVSRATRA